MHPSYLATVRLLTLTLLIVLSSGAAEARQQDAQRVDLLPPTTLQTTVNLDRMGLGEGAEQWSERVLMEKLSVLYGHQSDLMAAIARDDRDAVVASLDLAMTELGDLLRQDGVTDNDRFSDAYRMVVTEYERFYGPTDTLFVAFGDIFELRRDMFAALEQTQDPLLEDVVPSGLQPVGTDVPMTMNRLVENSMEFLLRDRKEVLQTWLRRADTYFPMIEQIFAEEGVPDELKYLAMIESGLNPRARSWASAGGMWQFMAATGRAYDLNVNAWVDDRADPELATRAAARHLKDLYQMYGQDWQVALAGYNCSPRCIKRAQQRARNTGISNPDYWDIYPYLPRETRNYVPMFIATSLIASNPTAFGVPVPSEPGPAYAYHVVPVTGMLSLEDVATMAGTDVTTLKALNPNLRRDTLPPSTGEFNLRLPLGTRDAFAAAYEALPPSARRPSGEYVVKSGDTLSGISQDFGVSVSQIMQKNGLRSTRINIGQRLVVPIADYTTDISTVQFAGTAADISYPPRRIQPIRLEQEQAPALAGAGPVPAATPVRTVSTTPIGADGPGTASATPPAEVRIVHVVRRGETLSGLATRYNVPLDNIRGWNSMSGSRINVGQRLTIYTDGRSAPATTTAESNEPVQYTVKRGDTLSQIAESYGVGVSQLRQWNSISGSNIRIGQRLTVYPGTSSSVTYTVQRGDTLIGIAGRHGVTVALIKDWNNLSSNTIRVGQQLRILRQ
ncbi:MAG: LysM peptidoglycan-binding domain-containing protein [Rhodothermales bacterium]